MRYRFMRSGFSLLEVSLSLAVMTIVIAGAMEWQFRQAVASRADAAAERMVMVRFAAQRYIETNAEALEEATAAGPLAIASGRPSPDMQIPVGPSTGLASLQGGGFLPNSYIDRNSFGQRTSLLVRRIEPGKIEGLVVAWGGDEMPGALLGRMSKTLGPLGGFVSSQPLPGVRPGTITGTFGGWRQMSEDWNVGMPSPSQGHAVTLLDESSVGILAGLAQRLKERAGASPEVDLGIPPVQSGQTSVERDSQGAAEMGKATRMFLDTLEAMKRKRDREACDAVASCD